MANAAARWRPCNPPVVPIHETGRGAGRTYHSPVKVERIGNAEARITEQDGQMFMVTFAAQRPITRNARMGSPANNPPAPAYTRATGAELGYHGRGHVRLTWWANYAAAGVSIGRGLDLLHNPEIALQPHVAYKLMAHGMITSSGFANGRQLQHHIFGSRCDYAGARALVNAPDPQPAIVSAARIFQTALAAARR